MIILQILKLTHFFILHNGLNYSTKTYGYKAQYFVIKSGDKFLAVIPLMIVDSMLTGKRAVSLPFSGPL